MITSTKNSTVTLVKSLNAKPKERYQKGLFVAEGKRLVRDIINSRPDLTEQIFVTENADLADIDMQGFTPEIVADHVMEAMCDTKTPQGILSLVRIPQYDIEAVLGENPLILILEDIRDPGNMGTIFRAFEAAGGSGIVLLGNCTDPFSPKCVRSTMGSIVRMPFITMENPKELKALKDRGVNIYAAHLQGEVYDKKDFTTPVAFAIGNEANGVSRETLSECRAWINIPMKGKVESLNAAITAALLSNEAARQRRN